MGEVFNFIDRHGNAHPSLRCRSTLALGCTFRFFSVPVWPHFSADFFRFRGTHVGIKSFQGKINLFGNPARIRREGPLKVMHTVPRVPYIQLADYKITKKQVSTMAFCCYHALPQATMPCCHSAVLMCCRAAMLPCCHHYCHCLSRGSSDGAGMAVCGGGRSSGSGHCGGSGGGGCGGGGGGGGGELSHVFLTVTFGQVLSESCRNPKECTTPSSSLMPQYILLAQSSTISYVSVCGALKRWLRFSSPIFLMPKFSMHRLNQIGQEICFQQLGVCCTSK